jgi:Secretion system C-terminal sorting domain
MKKHLLFFLYALLPFFGKSQDYSINTNCSTPFEDISTTGSIYTVPYGVTQPIPLPFNFNFYGQNHSQAGISGNGALFFTGLTVATAPQLNTVLPNNFASISTVTQAALFPFWDDFNPSSSNNTVFTEIKGNSPNRRFIIQWENRSLLNSFPSSNGVTFQIVLYETSNNFAFVYKDLDAGSFIHNNGASATIGIQKNRYQGELLSFNNPAYLTGRTCISFTKVDVNFSTFRYGVQSVLEPLPPPDSIYYNTTFGATLIPGSGTNASLADDQTSQAMALPFPFTFFNRTYDTICVSNNGQIYFGNLYTQGGYIGDYMYPYSTDIDGTAGGVYTKIIGSAPNRVFVIDWRDRPMFSNTANFISFQVQLYENGSRFEFAYKDLYAADSRDFGRGANISIRGAGITQNIFQYEAAISLTDASTNIYTLEFNFINLKYNRFPYCNGGTSSATAMYSKSGASYARLFQNGVHLYDNGAYFPQTYSFAGQGSYHIEKNNTGVSAFGFLLAFQNFFATTETFNVEPMPRAYINLFPNDTICSTEYAVLFSDAGFTAPKYLWNVGAQTAQAIRADSSYNYRVTVTDQHNNCTDTAAVRITKMPNMLVRGLTFAPISQGRANTSMDSMMIRLEPDSLENHPRFPLSFTGNYVVFSNNNYQFNPSLTNISQPNNLVTASVTDTLTGCIHTYQDTIVVLPNPIFRGLAPVYCGSAASVNMFRDALNYAYKDTIMGVFNTNSAYPNNIQFIRVKFNQLSISVVSGAYSGSLPSLSNQDSFSFVPAQATPGVLTLRTTYRTLIETINLAGTVISNKFFTAGQVDTTIQIGQDPSVLILDSTQTVYCEYDQYQRIRVSPAPVVGATTPFVIRNLTNSNSTTVTPNSLGEIYINPAHLDTLNDTNTRYRLTYAYSQTGCSRVDSLDILIPEPIDASFTTLRYPLATANLAYCNSSLADTLVPVNDTSSTNINRRIASALFFIDNIGVPSRQLLPSARLNPTVPIRGQHTIRYEIRDTFGCLSSTVDTFRVDTVPTLTLAGITTGQGFCADTTPIQISINLSSNFSGLGTLRQKSRGVNNNIVYNFSGFTGTYTADPDLILGASTIQDTVRYTFIFTDTSTQCRDSVSQSIQIFPRPLISFQNLPLTTCFDANAPIPLNVLPVGTIVQVVSGSPATAQNNLGTVGLAYTYTPSSIVSNQILSYFFVNNVTNCVNKVFDTVNVVNDPVTFSFAQGLPDYVCKANTNPLPIQVSVSGGSASTHTFSSNRVLNGLTALTPALPSTTFIPNNSDTGRVIISYTGITSISGCAKTIRDTIYVHQPPPIFIEFTDAINGDSICEFGQTVIFIQNYPQSSLPLPPRLDSIVGANINANQGVQQVTSIRYDFVPNSINQASRLRYHPIRARITDNYGCEVQATDSIKVIFNQQPFLAGLSSAYCVGSIPDSISGAPQGGNWYQKTNNTLYHYSPFSINTITGTYASAVPMVQTINPINSSNNLFLFQPNFVDTSLVIYQVQYPNGCVNADSVQVIVNDVPNLSITLAATNPATAPICTNTPLLGLSASVNGFPVYTNSVDYRDATPGGIISDSLFNPTAYPLTGAFDTVTRVITATFTDPNTGCSDTDFLPILVKRPPIATIQGLSNAYCVNNPNFTISGSSADALITTVTTGIFASRDGSGSILNFTNTSALFSPIRIVLGSSIMRDTIVYVLTSDNGCVDSARVIVSANNLPTGLSISMNDTIYCQNAQPALATGFPTPLGTANGRFDVYTSGGQLVDTSSNNTLNIRPAQYAAAHNIGNYRVVYRYQDNNGCVSHDTTSIEIHPKPFAQFTQTGFCVGDTVHLQDISTFAQIFNAADTLRFWNWSYQGQTYNNNNSTPFLDLYNVQAGAANAQLVVSSGANCKDTIQQLVRLYNNPVVNFQTIGGCGGDAVRFITDSSLLDPMLDSITYAGWDWGDQNSLTVTPLSAPFTEISDTSYTYAQFGMYYPSLRVVNRGYCEVRDTFRLAISPKYAPYISPYIDSFQQNNGSWYQSLPDAQAVWEWGVLNKPQFLKTNLSGNKVWATKLNAPYPQNGDTWIYAPCFDFTQSQKPMIKMDIAADLYDYDGVALQYFDTVSNHWKTIGRTNQGVDWYNNNTALGLYDYDPTVPYNPNVSSLAAWSGRIGTQGVANQTVFKSARYRLDELKGRDNVQMRLVFGAVNTPNLAQKEGFAFDNVWVGERRRGVLVEHFTNLNDNLSFTNTQQIYNRIYNQQNIRDVAFIQYHTNIGLADRFNIESAASSNSRQLYYGALNSEALINGGAWRGTSSQIDAHLLDMQMLSDPLFSINLTTLRLDAVNNTARLSAEVKAETNLNQAIQRNIYAAISEDSIPVFTSNGSQIQMSVFRHFLPIASGRVTNQTWAIGDTASVDYTWNVDIQNVVLSRLSGLVFIQNQDSKEILQASQVNNLDILTLPQSPVSVEQFQESQSIGEELFQLKLFPNPATEFATIGFDQPLQQDYVLKLVDVQGQVLQTFTIPAGSSQAHIQTQDLAAGVYVVQIQDVWKTVFASRKLVVVQP